MGYGNPTISNGRVFVGTDDVTLADDPRFKRSKGGLVKCLDEETGKLLWQLAIPKRPDSRLPEKTHFTHQHLGVCSSPTVDGDRVYVVTSAADIVCLDVNGQANGNDGPFLDEASYMVGRRRTTLGVERLGCGHHLAIRSDRRNRRRSA